MPIDRAVPWQTQLRGAFAFGTAPFAVHPYDERRALHAISAAIRDGADQEQIEQEIGTYLGDRNCDQEFIRLQIRYFREYFRTQYDAIKNCYVLSKVIGEQNKFISIFSGRKKFDDILNFCMSIYCSSEYNQATLLMMAKKKSWPVFQINFHKFPRGGLWTGKTYIGFSPTYVLEKSDAYLSKKLNPESEVLWHPKPIPDDPGESWEGLRFG